jgi:hypothetical protein
MSIGLIWGTSMFASFAVFGHHRSLNAVVIVGVVLVGNMAFTREPAAALVLFSLASLFLLIRAHVFDEQSEWLRRRIGDPASISTVYLRGGTTFIAVTVASFSCSTASSAPLWRLGASAMADRHQGDLGYLGWCSTRRSGSFDSVPWSSRSGRAILLAFTVTRDRPTSATTLAGDSQTIVLRAEQVITSRSSAAPP